MASNPTHPNDKKTAQMDGLLSLEKASRLFDRFYRGDEARGDAGSHYGLGLSIARTLTEQMGGRLESEFCAPRLRIIFSLPAEQNNAADTADTRA